jgi:hypothetical protein
LRVTLGTPHSEYLAEPLQSGLYLRKRLILIDLLLPFWGRRLFRFYAALAVSFASRPHSHPRPCFTREE